MLTNEDSPSVAPIHVRNPYNYDRDEASRQSGLFCTEPSLTSAEFGDETNINYMLEKYGLTGEITQNASEALQGDFSDVGDYRSMLDQLKAADAAFKALPAQVRRHFNDDPAAFTTFMATPGHQDQLREWGLLEPEPGVKPARLEDVIEALDRLSAAATVQK